MDLEILIIKGNEGIRLNNNLNLENNNTEF
jgi:hypothetical protein